MRRRFTKKRQPHCHSVKDYVTRGLFEQLMQDEEHHIDFNPTRPSRQARP